MWKYIPSCVAICVLGVVTGCTPQLGTVHGAVTFQGQPLEKGLVTFEPIGGSGGTAGGEIVKGKFTVKHLSIGKYRVHVEALRPDPKIVNPGDPETQKTLTKAEMVALADPLPPDTQGKDQELEVKNGEQEMKFELTLRSQR